MYRWHAPGCPYLHPNPNPNPKPSSAGGASGGRWTGPAAVQVLVEELRQVCLRERQDVSAKDNRSYSALTQAVSEWELIVSASLAPAAAPWSFLSVAVLRCVRQLDDHADTAARFEPDVYIQFMRLVGMGRSRTACSAHASGVPTAWLPCITSWAADIGSDACGSCSRGNRAAVRGCF